MVDGDREEVEEDAGVVVKSTYANYIFQIANTYSRICIKTELFHF